MNVTKLEVPEVNLQKITAVALNGYLKKNSCHLKNMINKGITDPR
jgi:hypothetical protein